MGNCKRAACDEFAAMVSDFGILRELYIGYVSE